MSGPLKMRHLPSSSQHFSGQLSPGLRRQVQVASKDDQATILRGNKPQWIGHDGAGARARRQRQREAQAAKVRKKTYGVEVSAEGVTLAGLVLPGIK